MKDFIEKINGHEYTIDQAKQLFIDYTYRHNGSIPERFSSANVQMYSDGLPNGSRAHANTNIEQNLIRMVRGKNSIVTFFHECKHLADAWKDSDGNWHSNWNDENNYYAQMEYSNEKNNEVSINRGVKGMAMGEAVAELYASKIFWELCGNSPQSKAYTANNRKTYDEEIIFLKKVCAILGIDENALLSWKSENNYGRQKLIDLFNMLTNTPDFWTKLEYRMDYISLLKFIHIVHPNLKVNQPSLARVEMHRKDLNKLLENCLNYNLQQRYYLSMGYSQNKFEQIYNKKIRYFQSLNNYMYPGRPNADYR